MTFDPNDYGGIRVPMLCGEMVLSVEGLVVVITRRFYGSSQGVELRVPVSALRELLNE